MSSLSNKYYLATLGCAKNELDSEALEVDLISAGLTRTEEIESADLILVNSCGFINDAKVEAIETTLDLHRNRKKGSLLVMCGCLPARYNLGGVFKEVDLFLPSKEHYRLIPYLMKIGWDLNFREKKLKRIKPIFPYGYLKISEGCDNRCSYCTIPSIKGPFVSRPVEEIVSEARYLCENSVKELILIGQDTTLFGADRLCKNELVKLIRRLEAIEGLEWLRIMYAHPFHLTDEIIAAMAASYKVVKYIDLPLQHINDKILTKMNRKIDRKGIEDLINKLRTAIPEIALRTTFIVGFPGESDMNFRELLDFCEEFQFDNLGAFKYSSEDGTPARNFGGRVEEMIIEERYLTLLDLQNKISKAKLDARVGKTLRVMVQEIENEGALVGRSWFQAPEVDGATYIQNCSGKSGDMIDVKITGSEAYDLFSVPL